MKSDRGAYSYRFVVRREGVASPYLYISGRDRHGNYQWSEELTEAAIFCTKWAGALARRFQNEFDGTVEALQADRAGLDYFNKVGTDCVNGY